LKSLAPLLDDFKGKRVLVIGDLMLDEYIWGSASRISPEAPVMVVDADHETYVPGGAANVAHNVVALGGEATVVGVIGEDLAGAHLREKLRSLCIGTTGIVVDPGRHTTRKTRIVAHHQQVLRVDQERRDDVSEIVMAALFANVDALIEDADAVILSDYRKGCLSNGLISHVVKAAGKKPITANPKPLSACQYQGVTMLSLNRSETEALTSKALPDPEAVARNCASLPNELSVKAMLVTLGDLGMMLLSDSEPKFIPALRVDVYDTAGAGDTVIAGSTLALASGANFIEAARFANLAGGCVVRKVGVETPSPEELITLAEASHYSLD
jgi:rfaE bifunctional protein kinase chain/domain